MKGTTFERNIMDVISQGAENSNQHSQDIVLKRNTQKINHLYVEFYEIAIPLDVTIVLGF